MVLKLSLRDLHERDLPLLRDWAGDPEVVVLWPDLGAQVEALAVRLRLEPAGSAHASFIVEDRALGAVGFGALKDVDWGERTATLALALAAQSAWSVEVSAQAAGLLLAVAFRDLALEQVSLAASPLAPWLLGGLERAGFRRAGYFDQPYYTRARVWKMARLRVQRMQYELALRLT